ncbi:MAG: cysteine--tRNA ligase [Erysipelotrichaceae bacterium]|nr:cysteine--tRNA ligase [Erysipelotrichaceae bacterium]
MRFYNSLSKKVEDFKTIKPGEVSMYVCGPTVYNYPHIGNMRPVVVFDTLRRFLERLGYKVTYVSNFTDVDDKIIKKAASEHTSEKELTDYFISEFLRTTHELGALSPSITPRVTEYMNEIISYVNDLVNNGSAYVVNGNVYFRVMKIKDYGSLSGIKIEDLLAGARIETNEEKESPLDFALWKKTSEGISWDSPWGKGRPGWHTECCVIVNTLFPPKGMIDIHGGGYDLKFPHHENEIAQSVAHNGNKIANYWIHNNFININDEKMSKSIGNVIYAKDLIERVGGNVVRMVILSTHYRMPTNFTEETIESAKKEISKLENAYKQLALTLQINDVDLNALNGVSNIDRFLESLADDLNTTNALTELFEITKKINQALRVNEIDIDLLKELFINMKDMISILGIDIKYVKLNDSDKLLYQEYLKAKNEKDFIKSDELRSLLIERKII